MFELKFVNVDEGKEILLHSDNLIEKMCGWERGMRMNEKRDVEAAEFREHVKQQVLDWTDEEKQKMEEVFKAIERFFSRYIFEFPTPINLVKTTGKEEINSCLAYCRTNAIVIPQRTAADPKRSVIVHELFHLQSQSNPHLRNALYAIVGFKRTENEVELPEELQNARLTNPDAPNLNVYINVSYNRSRIAVLPVLSFDITQDSFYSQLYVRLLVIEFDETTQLWRYTRHRQCGGDGEEIDRPMILRVDEVDGFFEQIGDCPYYFHPEEIVATYFTDLFSVPPTSDLILHKIFNLIKKT